ncbi:MAG: DinB family protein [Trueperaceae bacterium]
MNDLLDPALVLDAFDRNGRVNRATLAALDMEILRYDDGLGGFSVAQHLADMVSFRREWLARVSPQHAERVRDPLDMTANTWLRAGDMNDLQADFVAGDAAVRDAVNDAVREGRAFQDAYASHPAALLQHCIVHDAHHRGQIAALVRQSGRSEAERSRLEEATWAIWRE